MTRIGRASFGTHIVFTADQNSDHMEINTEKMMELDVSEDVSLAITEALLLLGVHILLCAG